jgi:hypothetical protein
MNRFLLVCLAVISSTMFSQTSVPPASGDGTVGNPYQIATLDNLYWIAESNTRWNYRYIQTSDIDASETSTWFSDGAGGFYGWIPIGNSSTSFSGWYNGQNFKITNIYVNRTTTDYAGFFGYLSGNTISNMILENVNISGKNITGGLAGFGISATVTGCSTTGTVFSTGYYAGGLLGWTQGSNVRNCFSKCDITAVSSEAGGLVGVNYSGSVIELCYATGDVTGAFRVGGLIGLNYTSGHLRNSYARGNVAATDPGQGYAGGCVGVNQNYSYITNCYSTGTVTGVNNIGGLLGYNSWSYVYNSFWDVETSGITGSKTTAEMKTQTTFTGATWDFVVETANGTNDYWKMRSYNNDGYPYMSWQIYIPDTPQNMNIIYSSESPDIDWDQVVNAESYKIYSSTDPYASFPAGWTLEASGITATSWTDTNASASVKKFYIVVAAN